MDFYNNLCKACKARGVSVSAAVVDAGEKLGSLSGWKNGAMPNSKAVIALSLRLNVSTDYLLGLNSADGISSDEQGLLDLFRSCSEADRKSLLDMAEFFVSREAAARSKRAE